MARIVQKFGGTSVGDLDRIRQVAQKVRSCVDAGNQVAVVVSAMAGTTNQLVEWAKQIGPMHDAREYDTIVSTGEQVTVGLLSIALQNIGVDARSWLGWQIPIKTDEVHSTARIEEIKDQVQDSKVLLGLSGGVDSSVTAALLHKAIGKKLVCVFVDNGLLRKGEADQVMQTFKENMQLNVIKSDSQETFLRHLKDIDDPEQKRKIIY